jgi:hypothetical protein
MLFHLADKFDVMFILFVMNDRGRSLVRLAETVDFYFEFKFAAPEEGATVTDSRHTHRQDSQRKIVNHVTTRKLNKVYIKIKQWKCFMPIRKEERDHSFRCGVQLKHSTAQAKYGPCKVQFQKLCYVISANGGRSEDAARF